MEIAEVEMLEDLDCSAVAASLLGMPGVDIVGMAMVEVGTLGSPGTILSSSLLMGAEIEEV